MGASHGRVNASRGNFAACGAPAPWVCVTSDKNRWRFILFFLRKKETEKKSKKKFRMTLEDDRF